jgi:hypothetical protein
MFLVVSALLLSLLSPASFANAAAGTVPGAPSNPVVSARIGNEIVVSWEAPLTNPESVIDYELRYSIDGGRLWTVFPDAVSLQTTATIIEIDEFKNYFIQIFVTMKILIRYFLQKMF